VTISAPEYCTGRRLWLLAMPSSERPRAVGIEGGDPGFGPGYVSAVTRSGGGTGTVSIYSGGPTDTFTARLEIVAGGALGTATYRTRLQTTEAWSPTLVTPLAGMVELPESGLILLLAGTFATGETHDFTTVEAAQQVAIRQGIAGEIDWTLRTRGSLPLEDWGMDLAQLAARCAACELLEARGFDPRSLHDKIILARAKRARQLLRKLRAEIVQGEWGGQGVTLGIAASSQEAQGLGPW